MQRIGDNDRTKSFLTGSTLIILFSFDPIFALQPI